MFSNSPIYAQNINNLYPFQTSKQGVDVRLDTTIIKQDEFHASIVSVYIYNINQERPIFLDQIITISKNDLIVYNEKYDGGIDSIKTNNGYLKYLSNFITSIGIIKTKNNIYFIIDGWGGCNDCSTYSSIIDENGKLCYKLFQNEKTGTVYGKTGNLKKVFRNKDDMNIYLKGNYTIIQDICMKCIQSSNKNSFTDPFNQ